MEILVQCLQIFFSVANVFSTLIGMIIGIIIGAIPGLGPTLVIALATPMIVNMEPVAGLLLLIGIYVGGIYGGSISAILINTPGTPAAAATVLDGYQMSKQGRPMKALQLALWASIFGHFFGSTMLFIAAEPLARFSLKFGPPEQFAMVLFALTIISVIAGKNLKKGLISAVFGLLFSVIGTDPINGSRRLWFGIMPLSDGIDLFALLIGLFAFSEVFRQISVLIDKKGEKTKDDETKIKHVIDPDDHADLLKFIKHWKLLIKSSAIGTFIGALPGIGSGTSAFVAYGWAQKDSKNPEKFGHGSEEGIIASESSNNACCGGALIPLLALGIPGDTVTAVLLGSMVMFGLSPGPLLFMKNANDVRVLYIGIFVCGIFLILLGRWILKFSSFITYINPEILWPIIAVVCAVGVYASKSSTFDIYIMFLFGLLGYVMDKHKFPMGPLLIAFILGPLLEKSLRQTLLMTGNNLAPLLSRPIFLFFIIITIISIVGPPILRSTKRLKERGN